MSAGVAAAPLCAAAADGAAESHGERASAPLPGTPELAVRRDAAEPAARVCTVREAAGLLADRAIAALPGWVERSVAVACERAGVAVGGLGAAAHAAGVRCAAEIGPPLRELLATDIDEQQTTPLSVLRSAVRFPTQVLANGGVPILERDEFDASCFPDDSYGLTPASFADIHPELGPIGIAWGAAKAFEVLQRRRDHTAEPARRKDTAEPARRDHTGGRR